MGTFKKLLSSLVDSAMMHRAETWGCMRKWKLWNKFRCVYIACFWRGHFASQSVTVGRDWRVTSIVGGVI